MIILNLILTEVIAVNLSKAIDQFVSSLKIERDMSSNTLKAYESDLLRFDTFLRDGLGPNEFPKIKEIGSLEVKDFMATMRDDEGIAPKSLCRILSSLRQFFNWCIDHGHLADSPVDGIRNPKVPQKLPIYLVEEEVSHLLKVQKAEKGYVGQRDFALISTFLYTGLRLSELRELNLSDIDFKSGTILVEKGKGRKQRLLPLHDELELVIRSYLENIRCTIDIIEKEAVFLKPNGRRMTSRAIGYALERSLLRAGLNRKYTPHKLRHTFATQLLHHGGDLLEIKKLLGHEQLSTTSIYTHTNITRLQKAVKKINVS